MKKFLLAMMILVCGAMTVDAQVIRYRVRTTYPHYYYRPYSYTAYPVYRPYPYGYYGYQYTPRYYVTPPVYIAPYPYGW